MFNNDFHGLDPRHNIGHAPGGIAPSRHTLSKHRYLQKKRARLDAEADERTRIAVERVVATAGAWFRRMLNAIRNLVHIVRIRWGANGIPFGSRHDLG